MIGSVLYESAHKSMRGGVGWGGEGGTLSGDALLLMLWCSRCYYNKCKIVLAGLTV